MSIQIRIQSHRDAFTLKAEFTVPGHGITALFGPSGCGKTSLLRAIAGLDTVDEGFLKINDDIWHDQERNLAPHERPMGFVFQEPSLFLHLSVRRNLEYGFKRIPVAQRRIKFDDAVQLLGLTALLDRNPGRLSGGERQRVAIARALLTSPRLLMLDEPVTALDTPSKAEILNHLQRIQTEYDMPMLYIGHAADEVAQLADHMVLMDSGRVLACGPIQELLTRFDLPLASSADAEAIIWANVAGQDDEFELTYVDFAGGRFNVLQRDLPVGQAVRLRVLARDVSLTLEHQDNTSILNIFPGVVEELFSADAARVIVRINLGGTPILAQITRKSATALCIQPGKQVFAQIKSVALLA
jgi:molybdate transport system ATP-binding protein